MRPSTLFALGVVLTVIAVVGLSACSSTHFVRRDAASYQQGGVEDLLKQWGPPTRTEPQNDGNSLYVYGDDLGFTHRYNPKTHEMDSIPNGCLTTFTVTPEKTVVAWQSKGLQCDDIIGVQPHATP